MKRKILVAVLAHTIVVIAFLLATYNPARDMHIHPVLAILDFPALALWYYSLWALPGIGALPTWLRIESFWSQSLGLVLFGGLQWALIIGCFHRLTQSRDSCCTNCGYNLTGNTSGVCPECGTKLEMQSQS